MSELRNAAAKGANSLGRSMKAEYAKTQQRARNDGNSQQKSVTAFAEDEVAESTARQGKDSRRQKESRGSAEEKGCRSKSAVRYFCQIEPPAVQSGGEPFR